MRPFWIWRSHATTTHQIDSRSVTPIVQTIGLRFPGGGWLWQFPLAVDVENEADSTHQRLPIPDPTRTVVWFLVALALVAALVVLVSVLSMGRKHDEKGQRTEQIQREG